MSAPTKDQIQSLIDTVQYNCHLSDARFAGDYTLCVYLLKMREFFRWENNIPFNEPLPQKELGNWISSRESLWDDIETQTFKPLPIDKQLVDPFNNTVINDHLVPNQLVYSAGIGLHGHRHFFIGQLQQCEKHDDYTLLMSDEEYARDLTAPPAMSQNSIIYIRRESVRRMIWEKVEEWRWQRPDTAMGRALSYYNLDNNFDSELDKITEQEIHSVILHEIGEIKAGEWLGSQWQEMLNQMPNSLAEKAVRAVRDHIADCTYTLPELLKLDNPASIHFYIGNMRALRKEMFPSLIKAYDHWLSSNRLMELNNVVEKGKDHWQQMAFKILELYKENGEDCTGLIEDLVSNGQL